jgi:hypothetical protein
MVRGDGFPRRVHDEVVHESEEAINAIKARGRTESVELEPAPGLELGFLDPDLVRAAQEGGGLTRCATMAATLCSIWLRARPSAKQAANRVTKPIARSVAPSNSAPASEVTSPPSNAATTCRPSTTS